MDKVPISYKDVSVINKYCGAISFFRSDAKPSPHSRAVRRLRDINSFRGCRQRIHAPYAASLQGEHIGVPSPDHFGLLVSYLLTHGDLNVAAVFTVFVGFLMEKMRKDSVNAFGVLVLD